jgi:hypothetical protein
VIVRRWAMNVAVAAAMAGTIAATGQKLPWQTAGPQNEKQLVEFLYPQQVEAPAGKPQVIELHFRIDGGLHINSHTPRQKSLIRTELIVAEPRGLKVMAVDFPPGSDYAFPAAPQEKLSVYSGEFSLKMHLTAAKGDHLLQSGLRYQACDTNSCFPPRTAPVVIDVVGQ